MLSRSIRRDRGQERAHTKKKNNNAYSHIGPRTRAGHGGAEEAVDEQHHDEHDAQRDGEVQQPQRTHAAVRTR